MPGYHGNTPVLVRPPKNEIYPLHESTLTLACQAHQLQKGFTLTQCIYLMPEAVTVLELSLPALD
jgi:hypothetical protein